MNPLLLGVLCGVGFGIADALITVLGGHFDVSRSMLLEAFTSRFAIGILGVNVSLCIDRVLAGALAGLSISLQDAFALDSYRVLDTVIMGNAPLWAALQGREALYAKPHDELTDEDGMRLGELEGIEIGRAHV